MFQKVVYRLWKEENSLELTRSEHPPGSDKMPSILHDLMASS